MVYGYNSKLSSHGVSKIMDYGRELLEELKKIRSSKEVRDTRTLRLGCLITVLTIWRSRLDKDRFFSSPTALVESFLPM